MTSEPGNRHALALVAVLAVAALYLGPRVDGGWIPHDEGLLAGSAERGLAGELPHRDFVDAYTGGLSFLHAAAFRLLGVHLLAPRLVLLGASLLFLAVFYRLAARAAPPLLAAAVSLTALLWSVPNYFAAMPSWYNLFFSAAGALALLGYLERGQGALLFAAGVAGGLSFLVKVNGLFFVAAALLVLVFRALEPGDEPAGDGGAVGFKVFVLAGLGLFVAVFAVMVVRRPSAMGFLLFVVPVAAVALVPALRALRCRRAAWRRLLAPGAVLLAGVALPVAVFLVPYVFSGSLGDFFHGVFVLPQRRLETASMAPPPVWTAAAVLPLMALCAAGWKRGWEIRLLVPVAVVLGLGVVFGSERGVYSAAWSTLRPLVPLAAVAGVWVVGRSPELSLQRRQRLYLVVAMTAMVSLVQFPFTSGIYFFYTAPWVVLVLVELAQAIPGAPRRLLLVVMVFYALFAGVWLNRGEILPQGHFFARAEWDTDLGIERGGLRVPEAHALFYRLLVGLVKTHSAEGSFVYAAPDCPEVTFLAGRKNPTRSVYDVFDEDWGEGEERARRILETLEEKDVDVVVINEHPEFSPPISGALLDGLVARYPEAAELGPFTVRWRAGGER